MPWLETSLMDQRTQFIADYQRDLLTVTELADRFDISRKTAYKWIDRYEQGGPAGLSDRSRRPQSCPHETPQRIVDAVLEARRHHPRWGAKKLLRILRRQDPREIWPARTTVCDLLKRHDLIPRTRRQPRLSHPGRPLTPMTEPNGIWTADVKGQFKTRDGIYCYPLTLVDGYSRYLLACQGLRSTAIMLARPIFRRAFEEYGLPSIIRSDNGVPFATTALGRLSLLSVWWIRLGIVPELIQPAHPEQNGRHERMHRTLKAEATRPPSGNLRAQQVRFNRFRTGVQRRTPARGARAGNPDVHVSPVATCAAADAHAAGIPGSFRSPSRQSQQRYPLEEALGLRDAHPRRRVRRPRRSRRRPLGRILRTGETRTDE